MATLWAERSEAEKKGEGLFICLEACWKTDAIFFETLKVTVLLSKLVVFNGLI